MQNGARQQLKAFGQLFGPVRNWTPIIWNPDYDPRSESREGIRGQATLETRGQAIIISKIKMKKAKIQCKNEKMRLPYCARNDLRECRISNKEFRMMKLETLDPLTND